MSQSHSERKQNFEALFSTPLFNNLFLESKNNKLLRLDYSLLYVSTVESLNPPLYETNTALFLEVETKTETVNLNVIFFVFLLLLSVSESFTFVNTFKLHVV